MNDKILVRAVNWIGDAVMTMPALRGLRKAYPDAHIALLARPSVAPLFEKDPAINEIIIYEDRFKGVIGKLKLAFALRRKKFTRALLFQNAFDAAAAVFLSGIPERTGYDRDGRGFLLTKAVSLDTVVKGEHEIHYYLNLLRATGISAEYVQPWIYLTIEERVRARETLATLKKPILGINPGATYGPAKRWFPERFAEVAHWFTKDIRGSVVIFGGPSETQVAEEIYSRMERQHTAGLKFNERVRQHVQNAERPDPPVLNIAGKTSLRELASLISECDVFLSNDSGPMHIAYAVGTPLVALFGSTDPRQTGPVGDGSVVVKEDFSCSPCFERTCKSNDMRCMHALTAEDVYMHIKKIVPGKPAVFLDRDGTLCEDVNYLSTWDDFRILPGTEKLVRLKERGFKLIGVSNQSGIARGIIREEFVREVNTYLIEHYGFDDFYYCPHHPDEHCQCRKPEPALIHKARYMHGVDPKRSYVVGDKEADLLLAKTVGAQAILVRTGQLKVSPLADAVVENAGDAVDFILREQSLSS